MSRSTIGAPFVFSYLFVSLIQVSHWRRLIYRLKLMKKKFPNTDLLPALHCSHDDSCIVEIQDRPRLKCDSIPDGARRFVRFELADGRICLPAIRWSRVRGTPSTGLGATVNNVLRNAVEPIQWILNVRIILPSQSAHYFQLSREICM